MLQQAAALADQARYQREAEKERAANNLADMRIYAAQSQQAQAQLDLVCYRLAHASIRASFNGVVVEGDLRERIGAPVKGATLIGNGPDVLTRVGMVGNDLKLDTGIGTCGKEGQSVPVGVGQPTLRIDGLTVGGTGQ